MAASSVTSPLCTWLVAACMSVSSSSEKDRNFLNPSKKLSRWARRSKVLAKCSTQLSSSFCGSSFQGLMSSFELCNEHYNSSTGISSLGFLENTGFYSLFGPRNASSNRRQRRRGNSIYLLFCGLSSRASSLFSSTYHTK